MNLIKYAFKELFNNRRFTILFVLNMSFGLTGFIALDGFKSSLDSTLKQKSKMILGADIGMSARRKLTEKEIQHFETASPSKNFEKSLMIELYSMAANDKRKSRLVQIEAIQDNYPFYGDIKLKNLKSITHKSNNINKTQNKIWVYPEILQQLNVNIGDSLFIGKAEFTIEDVVVDDAAAGISTSMAPRIYMAYSQMGQTGLLRPGSLAWFSYLYKVPSTDSKSLSKMRDTVYEKIDNPDVKVFTHESASQQMTRMLDRLNDFLGLTSLVALFLAGLGSGFLFRSYLKSRTKEIAIYLSLGLNQSKTFTLYILQIFILGITSSAFGILLSFLLLPIIKIITLSLLPFPVDFIISPFTMLLGMIIGTLGSITICLPLLTDLHNIKPGILLANLNQSYKKINTFTILSFIPGLILFLLLSIWLSNSFQTGFLFVGLFLGAIILLAILSTILFFVLNKFIDIKNLSLKLALRSLSRSKFSTTASFISIGLGVLLLNIIPQIQASLDEELSSPKGSKIPSFFMFDIQEEQLPELEQITKDKNIKISQLSPMIRARLTNINDENFDKGKSTAAKSLSREEESEMRFRNRGFNLSYRESFASSEKLIQGKPFSGIYNNKGLPEISLEKRFADRLNLSIDDTMTFDIEGVPIKGKVINFRSVKWTSFQPNFFIQFQPGVLEIAPKTYIATIPKISNDLKNDIQNQIVENLPNVSIIDVSRLISKISKIMDQMSWALKMMAILCVFAGFIVIYSIANHQANSRKKEIGLLKSLGAEFQTIRNQFVIQFSLIAIIAALMGAIISLLTSFFISYILFENTCAFDISTPLLSIIITFFITVIVTNIAIRSSLHSKTSELLF